MLPSRMCSTFSLPAMAGISALLPLKLKAEVREATRNPATFDNELSNSSARPSAKYSLSRSA